MTQAILLAAILAGIVAGVSAALTIFGIGYLLSWHRKRGRPGVGPGEGT